LTPVLGWTQRQLDVPANALLALAASLGLPRFIAANPPNALERKLQVCCIRCRLIKTKAQFYEVGCENCPSLIPKGSQEEVEEYTSKKFDGIISVVDPDDSWARKWVRLNKQIVPGVYAMRCREFLRQ